MKRNVTGTTRNVLQKENINDRKMIDKNLFESAIVQQFILIPNLIVDEFYKLELNEITLWIIQTNAETYNAIDNSFEFLRAQNKNNGSKQDYILLVTPNDPNIKYRYLNPGTGSISFKNIYGKIFPNIDELKALFPRPQTMMAWLEERSMH